MGGGDKGGGDLMRSRVPPPPAASESDDAWTEVYDEKSGKYYWWNEATDETTELGAPKPQGYSAVEQHQPQAQQGGLGRVVAEGFSFGIGSSIARMAIGSLFGDDDMGGGGGEDAGGDDDDWV